VKFDKFIEEFFASSEAVKIRSDIIPIDGVTEFEIDMATIIPYSFEIFNTGGNDMMINGVTVIKPDASLIFPRVGNFKRNDIIIINMGGVGTIDGFIRVDLELTG